MVKSKAPALSAATRFLTIPDYLNYCLTWYQSAVCEFTNATSTQCLSAQTGQWATDMLDALGIPTSIFPEIVSPGAKLAQIPGTGTWVVAPACHDTGSAVAAVPAEGEDFAWISSGTWSIVGIESPVPIISKESLEANFTNEGGVGNTYRFSKNVAGLWLVQQCRETWLSEGQAFDYADLMRLAASAEPGLATIDPDDPEFLSPGDMPARIVDKLISTGQPNNFAPGQIVRIVLESLALRYRHVVEQLEKVSGRTIRTIHIVGGGSKNELLNQLTADICGRAVLAGPVEASALGNLIMQMVAMGDVPSVFEGRQLIRNSFSCTCCEPAYDNDMWNSRYRQFLKTWIQP